MEYEEMKAAAEKITMPEEMRHRIIRNCRECVLNNGKERNIKANRHHTVFRKPAVVFATVMICLSLAVTAVAAPDVMKGFFRDITNWQGAVVGTSYEQATDEITVDVTVNGNGLTVHTNLVDPTIAPYRYGERLGIAAYEIVNAKGKTVKEGAAESAMLINGCADITIQLGDLETGNYALVVTSFLLEAGRQFADPPLPIHGHWECVFEK